MWLVFKHLYISDFRGFESESLLNLGKINLICGKNNSGKTSLLIALTDKHKSRTTESPLIFSHIQELRRLDDEQRASFAQNLLESLGNAAPRLNLITDSIDRALASRDIWHLDLVKELSNQIAATTGITDEEQKELINRDSSRFLSTLIVRKVDPNKVAYIPIERSLNISTTIPNNLHPMPSGNGIINALFDYKNQNTSNIQRQTYETIINAFKYITSGHTFDIIKAGENLNLQISHNNKSWRDANACGFGFRDLLIILFWVCDNNTEVVVVEEPESHLHPDFQRKLLGYLYDNIEKQFFFSTHSNIFLNNAFVDKVFYTRSDGQKLTVDDATSRASILDDLGYDVTDNLVSDLIVLVEGPNDIAVLEELLKKMKLLTKYKIGFWPLGGDIMSRVDLRVFVEHYKIIALIDSDPGSSNIRNKFIEQCNSYNIEVTQLQRYAIENYYDVETLRRVFKGDFPNAVQSIEPDRKLKDQIGFDVKRNSRKIARELPLRKLKGTDLMEFLNMIKTTLKQASKS